MHTKGCEAMTTPASWNSTNLHSNTYSNGGEFKNWALISKRQKRCFFIPIPLTINALPHGMAEYGNPS